MKTPARQTLVLMNGTSLYAGRLKEMTTPELLDAIAVADAGRPVDIYEQMPPDLIDKTTDAICEFIDPVKKIKQ